MNDENLSCGSAAAAKSPSAEHRAMARDRLRAPECANTGFSVASRVADRSAAPLTADGGYTDPESLAALSLAPLVAIAGAEGGVDDKERSLVLSWASDAGMSKGETAYRLVEQWLAAPPSSELLETWKTHYVAKLSLTLTREAKRELKGEILNRARALIEATGAFSGIGETPSSAEQAVIDEIDASLS
jgi:hypothetical protein